MNYGLKCSGFDFGKMGVVYDHWFLTPMGRYYDSAEKSEIKLALKNVSGSDFLK